MIYYILRNVLYVRKGIYRTIKEFKADLQRHDDIFNIF